MAKGKGGKGMSFRGGISELMKQAHRIQGKLEKVKEELKEETWTAEAAGGKIKVTISGEREVTGLEIAPELIDPDDLETLQDAVISGVNAAITLCDEKVNEATEKVSGGLNIPGLF